METYVTTRLIASRVHDTGTEFVSLVQELRASSQYSAQVSPDAVNDEFDRFKIWAGNIAAHRKGRRSLEYRLRDAPQLKEETHILLSTLHESLERATAIVKGLRTPWDEQISDSDSDLDSVDSLDRDEDGDTELRQLLASIKTSVTCLFRLSMAVRDPAPESQHRSTITVDKSFFETHDISHVKSKFPRCSDEISQCLGRAITGRRQYLTYREEHHQKLTSKAELIGIEEPKSEYTNNSTEATPLPCAPPKENPTMFDADDALSQTSYASSANPGTTIRIPPLPKEAHEGEHFECPYCFMIVSIHTKVGWKQHVYKDLHPYCCTFESCATSERLYDSRHDWFKHELEAHRSLWQCVEGCDKTFTTQTTFEDHVKSQHPDLAPAAILSALGQTSIKPPDLSAQTKCPLCHMSLSLRALQRHLGRHQEQLALFALPTNIENSEEEEEGLDISSESELSADEPSPERLVPPSGYIPPPGSLYRAIYDYDSGDSTAPSFRSGDVIQVITQLESGWWDGVLNGMRGWFPSNFFMPVEPPLDNGDWETTQKNAAQDESDLTQSVDDIKGKNPDLAAEVPEPISEPTQALVEDSTVKKQSTTLEKNIENSPMEPVLEETPADDEAEEPVPYVRPNEVEKELAKLPIGKKHSVDVTYLDELPEFRPLSDDETNEIWGIPKLVKKKKKGSKKSKSLNVTGLDEFPGTVKKNSVGVADFEEFPETFFPSGADPQITYPQSQGDENMSYPRSREKISESSAVDIRTRDLWGDHTVIVSGEGPPHFTRLPRVLVGVEALVEAGERFTIEEHHLVVPRVLDDDRITRLIARTRAVRKDRKPSDEKGSHEIIGELEQRELATRRPPRGPPPSTRGFDRINTGKHPDADDAAEASEPGRGASERKNNSNVENEQMESTRVSTHAPGAINRAYQKIVAVGKESAPRNISPEPTKTRRLPHNQIERKYRENLDAEMERLRRAIPSLAAQGAEPGAIGSPIGLEVTNTGSDDDERYPTIPSLPSVEEFSSTSKSPEFGTFRTNPTVVSPEALQEAGKSFEGDGHYMAVQ